MFRGVAKSVGLFFGGRPFHRINLPLWEGDANAVVLKAAPDGLSKITADSESFEGIPDPEQESVIDGGICKIDRECLRRWVLQYFLVFFSELFEQCNHLHWLMVVGGTDNDGITARCFVCGVGLCFLGEEVLIRD